MALVGGGSCGGGGVDDQARAFAGLLHQVLPVVLSGGLPDVADPPNPDTSDDEEPLLPPLAASASTMSKEVEMPRQGTGWFSRFKFKHLRRAAHDDSAPRIPPHASSSSTDPESSTASGKAVVPPSATRGSPPTSSRYTTPNESTFLIAPSASSGSSSNQGSSSSSWELMIPPPATQRLLPSMRPRHAAPDMFDASTARRRNSEVNIEIAGRAPPLFPSAPVPHRTPALLVGPVGQGTVLQIPVDETLLKSFFTFQQEGSIDWLKIFGELLVTCVFFVPPLILVVFPWSDKENNTPQTDKETNTPHSPLSLLQSNVVGLEKGVLVALFLIHATFGLLGVLLAHIAHGHGSVVVTVVGSFTLGIVITVVAFVDYLLSKTFPDEAFYHMIFLAHFVIMAVVICFLWFKYVAMSCCCCFKNAAGDSTRGQGRRPSV